MSDLDYSSLSLFAPPNITETARTFREDGGSRLTDFDLLAVILGPRSADEPSAAAYRVLQHGGLASLMDRVAGAPWWKELRPTQGVRLAAALEVGRRVSTVAGYASPYLNTPRDVFDATADLRMERREHFVGLYLNTRNRLLARETISVGSLNAAIVHPREVFEPALRHGAASAIVVHNHPSGETDPSEDDLGITRRLEAAAEILGITLVDHVIVGVHGFTSMKESRNL